MSRTFVSSALITSSLVSLLVACGGTATIGKTDTGSQQLQKTKDGGSTGNGTTCSWANTSVYDQYGRSAPVPSYAVGDEFKSIDGCNECTCTDKGIMCTIETCTPQACQADAMICPDGKTSVGRTGPKCTFAPCPGDVACTDDAKKCPDGSYVGRTGPNCEFATCGGTNNPPTTCPALAKLCPDGSYASPSGPNCEFVCPATSCSGLESEAATKIRNVVQAHLACETDTDCEVVAIAADCTDQCSAPMAKSGEADYKAVLADVGQSICTEYAKQSCKLIHPACAPSQPPHCGAGKTCQ